MSAGAFVDAHLQSGREHLVLSHASAARGLRLVCRAITTVAIRVSNSTFIILRNNYISTQVKIQTL
jgi:hypothetical protein